MLVDVQFHNKCVITGNDNLICLATIAMKRDIGHSCYRDMFVELRDVEIICKCDEEQSLLYSSIVTFDIDSDSLADACEIIACSIDSMPDAKIIDMQPTIIS